MALPKDYREQRCSLSRSLEVLGERWTLLIVRDAFYGVRRFSDFAGHLNIPRSVLAARLDALVDDGVLTKMLPAGRAYAEYELTDKGRGLWPVVHGLIAWGDEHYARKRAPLLFEHIDDGGKVGPDGFCASCQQHVTPEQMQTVLGPGVSRRDPVDDVVTEALQEPHPLFEDVRSAAGSGGRRPERTDSGPARRPVAPRTRRARTAS
jgi:DNA-binding HxlR family transcriptional regulator